MDEQPPPPYSLRDPHITSAVAQSQPQSITAFNALIAPTPLPELPIHYPPVQASIPARYSAPPSPPISQISTTIPLPRVASGGELERSGFVSAAPYFELRNSIQTIPPDKLYHHLAIPLNAQPNNLPFPQPADKWVSRGVDSQDWMTFLNHLFLPCGGEKSSDVAGQELEAEADLDHPYMSSSKSRDQLRPLLSSRTRSSNEGQDGELEQLTRVRIEAVTKQWNEGFFEPRGLEVLVNSGSLTSHHSSSGVLQGRTPPLPEDTLLHQACIKGKKSQVKEVLAKGYDNVDALNKKGQTALFIAVNRGDKDIVQLLLDHNADPTLRPPDSDSNIHVAVYNDRKSILKLLLARSRAGIEERNSKDQTPLWVAVTKHHTSCAEILLDAGANPNARPIGLDSMLNVVVSNDNKSIAKLLLQKGADVEERNSAGEGPLYRAVSRGNSTMVKHLLDHGALVSAITNRGAAPLSEAVGRGDRSIVLLLLAKKDIDVEVENEKGQRPLYQAISRGDTSIAEQLLRKGADPGKYPAGGESPLNLAVGRGNTSLTQILLDRGADAEETNRSGETALFVATSRGDASVVSLLLSKGADPNTRNPTGETALQRATNRSNISIASLLLGRGADPDLSSTSGEVPLYQAVHRNNTSMVSILLSHGSDPNLRGSNGQLPLERAIYSNSTANVALLLGRGADLKSETVNGESMVDYAEKKGDKTIIQLCKNYSLPQPAKKNHS